jgi:hypothetical protein
MPHFRTYAFTYLDHIIIVIYIRYLFTFASQQAEGSFALLMQHRGVQNPLVSDQGETVPNAACPFGLLLCYISTSLYLQLVWE